MYTDNPETVKTVIITTDTITQLKEAFTEEACTIVQCVYVSKKKFVNGGWVNIYPTTYLKSADGTIELQLLHAVGIPVAPAIHVFDSPLQVKRFTLYFPAIPKDWEVFSLMEYAGTSKGFKVNNIRRNNAGVYYAHLV